MKRERDPILERVRQRVPPPLDAFERLERRRQAKAMRSRVVAGGLGLVVTVALVAGVLLWGSLTDRPKRVPLALGSSSVPLVAGNGQYYYTRVAYYGQLADGSLGKTSEEEVWVGLDDSGRFRSHAVWGTQDRRYGSGQFPGELLTLSSDPADVLQQLIERGSPGGASPNPIPTTSPGRSQETTSLLRTAEDLVRFGGDALLTPEQTRVLYEALQGLPDVTTEPGVVDPVGRRAVRLSFVIDYPDYSTSTERWYFSPDLGQFLGGSGAIIEEAGISDSLDAPPAADARYVEPGSGTPNFGGIDSIDAPQPTPKT